MRLALALSVSIAVAASLGSGPNPESNAADEPLAPEAVKPLTQVAKELAKAGRAVELEEVLEVLQVAGMEAKEAGKLAAACRADAAKVKKPADKLPSVAKSLKQLADALAARIEKADEPARAELARLVLRLDGQDAAAQRALGREKVGSEWLDARAQARRKRHAEIGSALAKSRALEIKIAVGKSDNPIFAAVPAATPSFARCGNVVIHGVWPGEKLERVLRQVLRALAFDNFVIAGEVGLPELPSVEVVFLDSSAAYAAAVRLGVEKKWIKGDQESDPTKSQWIYLNNTSGRARLGELMSYDVLESAAASKALHDLLWSTVWKGAKNFRIGTDLQKCMFAGTMNWTCLECFGCRMANYLIDVDKPGGAAGTASSSPEEQKIRERYRLLAEAGISGGRTWMRYLAARRQDPPLASLFVDQLGRLQGDELLKMTLIVEMLAEDGPLLPLMTKLPLKAAGKSLQEGFEKATGAQLAEFDAAWRSWLLPSHAGLVERLEAAPPSDAPLGTLERPAIDTLNELRHRAAAGAVPVELDREASEGCRDHALYLAKNPAQLTRWPDAHEEYPDRPDFDVKGAWAGTHAVVFPGVKDARTAIDGWMATFYHRVPLLEEGLVRVGFALEGGIAVLDSGSFVRPRQTRYVADADRREEWSILWPPSGATGVPTSYSSELPHPVPGEDESKMGYPITLQLSRSFIEARIDVELALHLGTATGEPIACWCSTPTRPTNPALAPDAAWCLIPRAPLQSGSQYTVTGKASWNSEPRKEVAFSWAFRCGR